MTALLPFPDDSDRPPQAARLGPEVAQLGRAGRLLRDELVEVRGMAGEHLQPGPVRHPREVLPQEVRVASASPSTPRRFPRSAATSPSTSSRRPTTGSACSRTRPARSSSRSRCPRTSRSRSGRGTPATGSGREGERAFPGRANLSRTLFTRRLEPYAERVGHPHLRVRDVREVDLPDPGRLPCPARPVPRGACPAGSATPSRSATPSTSAPTTSPCSPATAWPTCSAPGRACPSSAIRSRCRGRSRPTSRWSAPSWPGDAATRQAVQSFEPYQPVRSRTPAAARGSEQVAERSRERKKPAFLFVNNRLEGHAPTTIEAVADRLLEKR